jgi:hypothetical protein
MLVPKLTLCAGAGFLWALAAFNTTWTANLSSVNGSNVIGTATVDVSDGPSGPSMQKPDTTKTPGNPPGDADKSAGGSWAAISINGAAPGEYPWKISSGGCGTEAAAVGSEGTEPIKVQADGRGTARSKVDFQPKPGAEYSVSVLKSKSDRAVISCGKLEPSGQLPSPPARDSTAPKP